MISTLIPNKSLTVITSKLKVINVKSDHPNWYNIMSAFKLDDENLLIEFADMKSAFKNFGTTKTETGNITVDGNSVLYKGKKLFGLDVDRIIEFCSNDLPKDSMIKFLEKKLQNPSYRSIEQLYTFLENKHMPITPDGNFLAYKGIQSNWYSVTAGSLTLISGKADGENNTGHIYNGVGEVIECPRNEVCDDFEVPCSPGLHAGSLEYAKGWGEKMIIVEINPSDVVCVPKDCSCQKLRCNKYKVVGEFINQLPDTFTTQYSDDWISEDDEDNYSQIEGIEDAEYNAGFVVGEDDATCGLIPAVKTFNDEWERGYLDGFNKYIQSITPKSQKSIVETPPKTESINNPTENNYNEGYDTGFKDGKSHSARLFCDDGINVGKYAEGYNKGYRDGRKDYKK
jgi:hypothetical protein